MASCHDNYSSLRSLGSGHDFDDDLKDVVEMLSGKAAIWRTIALNLCLRNGNIEVIQENHRGNATMCLQLAITDWLRLEYNWKKKKNGLPSWKKLAEVVRGIDNALYLKIVEKHPKE